MIWCLFGFSIFGRLFSELFFFQFCVRFFWFVGETTVLSLVRLCDIEASQLYLKYWKIYWFCISSGFLRVFCPLGLSYSVSRCMLLYS